MHSGIESIFSFFFKSGFGEKTLQFTIQIGITCERIGNFLYSF